MTTKKTTKKKTSAKPKAKKPAAKKKTSKPAVKAPTAEQADSSKVEHEKAHGVALDSVQKHFVSTADVLAAIPKQDPKKKKSLWRRIVGFGL